MSEKTTPTAPTAPTDLPLLAQRPRPAARALAGPSAGAAAPAAVPTPASAPGQPAGEWAGAHTEQALHERVAQGVGDLNWQAVRELRAQVTETWRQRNNVEALNEAQHREPVQVLVEQALDDYSARQVQSGLGALGVDLRNQMRRGVLDSLFGAGRFQHLVDLEGIENVNVDRYDRVRLEFVDGRIETGPPVADSNEDLIAELQQIARTAPTGEREFSPANKKLRMPLPDGSRLAADGWYSPWPTVSIRKHRYIDTSLRELSGLGMLDTPMVEFLSAASRAGLNIAVAGHAGAGKTTLARGLLNALDPRIRIGTVESQYELLMHELTDRHHSVVAFEAQQGGELGPDGRRAGSVTLTELIHSILQHNVTRLVVGEVVGPEIMAMINAMQSGHGSLTTVHADSAYNAVERLATLILQDQANASVLFAERLLAAHIDLIVHVAIVDESHLEGGRKHRFVDEVIALQPMAEGTLAIAKTALWRPGADLRGRATGTAPPRLDELVRHGFDERLLDPAASDWGPSPQYLVPPVRRGEV